jgi:hypothetical protein
MTEDSTITTPDQDSELKHLEAMEAEQAAEFKTLGLDAESGDTPPAGDRAPADGQEPPVAPVSKPTDTPSEAEKQEVETAKAEAEKEGKELDVDDKGAPKRGADGKFVKRDKVNVPAAIQLTPDEWKKFDAYLAEKQGSKYAKDFTRRLVTWSELNAAKDKHSAEVATHQGQLKAAIEKFNADVAQFQAEKAATTPTPEKYEAFATKQTALANEKELAAKKAEDAGDFDGAEKLRDEAKFARRDAEAATKSAEHVRKNPPANAEQVQAKFVADQKTWVDKAAVDFPEFGKKDSPVFQEAVAFFREITKDPAVAKLPGIIYFAAERAALKTASARVPGMEKELGELRTKVKDLEALTNPTPSGGVPRVQAGGRSAGSMSEEELYQQLREEAAAMR